MKQKMSYGKNGMALTKSFEKCRLVPYKDEGGVWTNGWGNTHGVVPGRAVTQAQADAQLLKNVQTASDCVNQRVLVDLDQDKFDSLVDFAFNVGVTAFSTSTLLKKLNAGDLKGAYLEFDRWNISGGHKSLGLDFRRDGEQELFVKCPLK